ncbi:bifunctional aspartate kinase/homoserine dehydrogenase II [Pseudoalteromonas sp. CNC9-20]|uniref:bifunctional aspartate kinase/homoserine dehydrogenase II n=1 Tax=Pseudoalteromonas sp. CNC9-20 TaxID=2917750 RepID=UPI001EF6C114|nr:bifunctional aspartate kinase/homoserine dehydrogenase II [Pseudoalteromonas sp. CNC9-20]MCG7569772.1 bifunctional aspartate kinase/homoserine dehydrogenase II [Pseudoalteromonas sp. CNC9-20]
MTQVVHKFGGSSLSNAARYHAVANIIIGNSQLGDVVVVSAAGKTTDTLVKLWQAYQQHDSHGYHDVLQLLRTHQHELIDELLAAHQAHALQSQLNSELQRIAEQLQTNTLDEASLLAHGELWSARLLATYLQQLGYAAQDLDARQLLCVHQGQLLHLDNEKLCERHIARDKINVVTGFIAADSNQQTVTLGRNGSDYSATLLARYVNAKQVCIWTDTQGVFSTDPRKVADALKYQKICRGQANRLAQLGNPVLHAKTLSPLQGSAIKLSVRSSYDSGASGTEIVREGYCKHKRFLTTIEGVDLYRVSSLKVDELATLSQLIQHTIGHFQQQGVDFLIVPSAHSTLISRELGERGQLVESNLNGCALVSPNQYTQQGYQEMLACLEQLNLTIRFSHCDQDYALVLTDQIIDADSLGKVHRTLIGAHQQIAVIVAGLGNVGSVFLQQFTQQLARLEQHFEVKLVGLLRSRSMLFDPCGLDPQNWQGQWLEQAVPYQSEQLCERLNELDYEHKVVIDITASESFSGLYPDFVRANCHLISANKYAGTAPHSWYQSLRNELAERNLKWRYNTSVGAGLPINFALADLQRSGDEITRIQGVFSGTLSWLCSHYDGSQAFSELLFAAQKLGFTEPDPREDLSGRDVQRKLLILARELGLQLDIDDIELSPLMPESLAQGSWQDFLDNIALLDDFVGTHAQQAQKEQKVLRYNADLRIVDGKVKAQVGLVAVAQSNPLAGLSPGDNIFVINSRWYAQNALVIQGPGAGKEVTAAGVHSDLYWLIESLS